jgi:hypothetical protein
MNQYFNSTKRYVQKALADPVSVMKLAMEVM